MEITSLEKIKKQNGYTIIETMIAVSLFLVIIISGMGVFLNANLLHQKSQNMRSIMDNISFIMEDMSRNLRTGRDYECYDAPRSFPFTPTGIRHSCKSGWGVAFKPETYSSTSPNLWVYYIDGGKIFKSTNSGATFVELTPSPEVVIKQSYGFSVLGAESVTVNSNTQQPLVTIRLVGDIEYKDTITPFSLQTSVSQRLIDI